MAKAKKSKKPAKAVEEKKPREWRPSASFASQLFDRDNDTCIYCQRVGGKLSVDHVVTRTEGGNHKAENLLTACSACNSLRGACPIDLWVIWCQRLGYGTPLEVYARVVNATQRPLPPKQVTKKA